MQRLTSRFLRKLLDCLGELYTYDDLEQLKQRLPGAVTELVPTDFTLLNDYNLSRCSYPIYRTYPADARVILEPEFVAHVYQEHPIIRHIAQTGSVDAVKVTDFMSQRQYRETRIYREGLRLNGVEYNMGFQLFEPHHSDVSSISLIRQGRDFSEADRLKLDLLRPHVARAYANAQRLMALRARAAVAEEALAATRQALIALTTSGRVLLYTEAARACLARCFGEAACRQNRLPAPLRRWLAQQELPGHRSGQLPHSRKPFVAQREGGRLTIHLVTGTTTGQRFLLLEESSPEQLSAAPLEKHLGLTPRRAEVLLWVTQGKTSAEVATILGLSPGTVNKHLEHIFASLGVETRTAAALRAMEVLSHESTRPWAGAPR